MKLNHKQKSLKTVIQNYRKNDSDENLYNLISMSYYVLKSDTGLTWLMVNDVINEAKKS